MGATTFNSLTTFQIETCCRVGCGVQFAMTDEFYQMKRRSPGQSFYCPNGHGQHYVGKSDAELRREAEEEANRQLGLRRLAEAEVTKAQTIAKRETTKRKTLEKRIKAGMCPHCHRHFQDLQDHVSVKHGTPVERTKVIKRRKAAK